MRWFRFAVSQHGGSRLWSRRKVSALGRESIDQPSLLGGIRPTRSDAPKCLRKTSAIIAWSNQEPFRQRTRRLDVLDIVHQGQRLQRGVGANPADAE